MATRYEQNHQHRGLDVDGSPVLRNPKFGDVEGDSYTEILTTGQVIQKGKSVMYDDMNFPFSTGRVSQVNAPTWTTMIAPFGAYTFAVNNYLQVAAQEFPHTWAEGTPAEVHVHMVTNGTNTTPRSVKHKVQITWANAYDGKSTYNTVQTLEREIVIPANTPNRTHLVHSLGTIDMRGGLVGAYLGAMYTRIAASGTAPTNNPFILAVGLHIQLNSLGSLTRYTKGV